MSLDDFLRRMAQREAGEDDASAHTVIRVDEDVVVLHDFDVFMPGEVWRCTRIDSDGEGFFRRVDGVYSGMGRVYSKYFHVVFRHLDRDRHLEELERRVAHLRETAQAYGDLLAHEEARLDFARAHETDADEFAALIQEIAGSLSAEQLREALLAAGIRLPGGESDEEAASQ